MKSFTTRIGILMMLLWSYGVLAQVPRESMPQAEARSLSDLEAANERVVRAFIAETSADLRHYRNFLAENVIYQYEGNRVEGKGALLDKALGKMSSVKTFGSEMHRISVVGNTVLNDRIDVIELRNGQKIRLSVTSVFLIANGKIAEWREYPRP